MRYLFVALIIAQFATGCAPKIETTTPALSQVVEFQQVLKAKGDISKTYSGNTQSAFGILWPQEFDAEDKALFVTVLSTAKDLQETQKTYTTNSNRIKKASAKNQCECVLTGICDVEIAMEEQDRLLKVCTEIEADQIKNDERLANLVRLQQTLKSSVLKMGGYWLDVSSPLVYDFSTGLIDFKGAEFFNSENKRIPLNGDVRGNAFWTLDTVVSEGALKVQGELKVKHGGNVYRGELGFQLPERGD